MTVMDTVIHCPSAPLMKEFLPQMLGVLLADSLHRILLLGLFPLERALCPKSGHFMWCPTPMLDQCSNVKTWPSQANCDGSSCFRNHGCFANAILGPAGSSTFISSQYFFFTLPSPEVDPKNIL